MFVKHKLLLVLAFVLMLGGAILATSPSAVHAASLKPLDGYCPGNETTCGGGCQDNGIVTGCISVDSHRNLHAHFTVDSGQTICMLGYQYADPILYLNFVDNEYDEYPAQCYGGGYIFPLGRDSVLNNDGHDVWFGSIGYKLPNGSNGDWITPNQYL